MAILSIPRTRIEPQDVLLATARLVLIGLPLPILLPLHLIWQTLKLPSPWAMLYLRIVARVLGARVKVHGTRLRHDVFFVANHLSWHDIPILGGVTGTAFVAQNKTIFVNRAGKHQVSDQINVIREAIAENWSVTLFPEGTTSDGLGLLPFKPSLFETLAPPPKPIMIQPVLLDFGDEGRDIAWLGEETGGQSAWRAFTRRGSYEVGVHFLEPYDPSQLADRKEVCAHARNSIAAALSKSLGYTVH